MLRCLLLAGMMLAAGTAHAWYVRLDRDPLRCGRVESLTTDGAGDVVAAGVTYDCTEDLGSRPALVKLRGADGAELWRRDALDGTSGECAAQLQVVAGGGGALAVAGSSDPCFDDGLPDEGFAARLTPDGDVVWLRNLGDGPRVYGALAGGRQLVMAGATLVSLDALSGATIWSTPLAAPGSEMRVSASGHAVVVTPDGGSGLRVAAYDAATGAERWATVVPGAAGFQQRLLFVGSAFGVGFVAITAGSTVSLLTVDGGSLFWTRDLPADTIVGAAFDGTPRLLIGTFLRGATANPDNRLFLDTLFGGFVEGRNQLAGGPEAPSSWIMEVDRAGDLLFAGGGGHARLLKVGLGDLVPRWEWAIDRAQVAGEPTSFSASALTTDLVSNVILGGRATEPTDVREVRDAGGTFAVMKRTAATGGNFPCGNGVAGAGETCDDGNAVDGDACDASCRPPGCGSGRVSGTEECDDGNTTPGDGCSATCMREPGCGVLDLRGRWEAQLDCALRDSFGQHPFPLYLGAAIPLDVGQRCADGALSVRLPPACGQVHIDDSGEVALDCSTFEGALTGQVNENGSGFVLDDVAAVFELASPITPSSCALVTMRTGGGLSAWAQVDRPGHASLAGAVFSPELVLANATGATCVEKDESSEYCTLRMERRGTADGACVLGCEDADPCTTDACDDFGWCTNALVTGGAPGAICHLRNDFETGEACAGDREGDRVRRLLHRLEPRRIDDPPRWMVRAEMRVVRRVTHKIRGLKQRGILSRSCGRAVLENLRAVGRTLRDALRAA